MKTFLNTFKLIALVALTLAIFVNEVNAQEKALTLRINGKPNPVPNDTLCLSLPDGDNDLALTGSASGGPGPISFPSPRWTGTGAPFLSSTTTNIAIFDPNLSGAGTFVVTFNAIDGVGNNYSVSKTIIVDAALSISMVSPASGTVDICAIGSVTLQAAGAAEYYWYADDCAGGGYDLFNVIGTGPSITVTPSASGTCMYLVQGFSALGCPTDPQELEFTVNAGLPPTVNADFDQTICANETVTLNGSIGGTATSATWTTSGSGTFAPSATTLTAVYTPSPADKTAVTVTLTLTSNDPAGPCDAATDQMTITINALPLASAGVDKTICSGLSTTLTATGGGSYEWNTTATTATITVNPAVQTTYTVTVTNANGCSASDAAVVFVNALPTASAGVDKSICIGNSTTLTATGGGSYLWNTTATTATITVSPLVQTTYTVTVTNANGCSASDDAVVFVNALPTASAGVDKTICSGQNTTLTATGGGSYLWNTTATTATITVNPVVQTTYTVTVSNANGCSASDAAVVFVNALPTASAGVDKTICSGQNTTLTATGGGSYLWNTTATTATITVNPAVQTTYTVTVTNANGCSASDAAVVFVNALPAASAGVDKTICTSQNTTLTATGGGSYLWNTTATTAAITVSPAVQTTYTVTVTNANGCSASDNAVVFVNALPTASAGVDKTICSGQNTSLTATGGGSYLWNTTATTATITVNPVVQTTYTVTVTNANGCSASDAAVVFVNALPTASAGVDKTICSGQNTTLTATGGGSYLWNTTATTATITVNPAIQTTYTVTVTNGNGCSASDAAVVFVNALPTASAGVDKTICANQNTTLTATGGGSYLWNTTATTATITVNPAVQTTYTVTVTNANGCSASDAAVVFVNTLPTASAGVDKTICSGQNTTLTATGGGSYLWNTTATTATITVNPAVQTTYTVTISNANGCSASDAAVVFVNALPTASAGVDKTICSGQNTTLTATGGGSYLWNTTATTATITVNPAVQTTYTVTVTNANGCSASDAAIVFVNVLPTASAGVDKTICSGQNTTLTATGGGSYLWNTTATTATITVNPAVQTTYTVTVTNANGCSASDAAVVFVNALPTASAGVDKTICSGQNTTLTATGGGSYLWNTTATTATTTVNPAVQTTYTVTVTNANGCSASDAAVVFVNPLPTASAGVDKTLCLGSNTTLTATGGGSYSWNTAATTATITVSPPINTIYTVTVTLATGCSASDAAAVTVAPLPVAAASDATICAGQSATLTATGGGSYSWNTNAITPTITVSPAVSTTYTVTVTVGTCSATDNGIVTVNPLPTVSISSNPVPPLCAGSPITLTASGAASYTWNPGGSNLNPYTVTPLINTTYTVTGASGAGCTSSASLVVNVNPVPAPHITGAPGPMNFCIEAGDTAYLPDLGSFLDTVNYTMFTPGATITNINDIVGIKVNIEHSWLGDTYFEIKCPPPASRVVTLKQYPGGGSTKMGEPVFPDMGPGGAMPGVGYDYWWKPTSTYGTMVAEAGAHIQTYTDLAGRLHNNVPFLPEGSYQSAQTLSGLIGCPLNGNWIFKGTDNMGIDDGNIFNWGLYLRPDLYTDYTDLNADLAGGVWSGPGIVDPVNGYFSPVVAGVGDHWVKYCVTNAGCTGCDSIEMVVKRLPQINAGADRTICAGASVTLDAGGGGNGYSYAWNTTPVQNTQTITVSPLVNTTYIVTATATNLCAAVDTVVVIVNPIPTVDAGTYAPICLGSCVTMTATGSAGSAFVWNSAPTANPKTVCPIATSTYTVTATLNGCSASDNTVITVNPLPVISAGTDQTICNGNSTSLTATGGVSYTWSLPGGNPITVTPTITTTYTVTGTDANGCTGTDEVVVVVDNVPTASAGPDVSICAGQSTTLTASGGNSYHWSDGTDCATPTCSITVTPLITTTYTVTVTNAAGCTGTDNVVVTIITLPTINAGLDQTICAGTPVNLTANGGASYTWTPGGCFTANCTVNPLVNTTYTVTGSNAFGCTASDEVVVTVNSLPIANAGLDVTICAGTSTTLTATGGTSYTWNVPGLNPITVNPIVTTTYTVTVGNATGCTASDDVIVTVNPQPTITITTDVPVNLCYNSPITLTANGGTSYTWNTGVTTNPIIVTPLVTTTYSVTGTDAAGCSNTASIVITVFNQLIADAGPATLDMCNPLNGGTAVLGGTPTASGGSGAGYHYNWSATSGAAPGDEPNPTVAPTISTTYCVTVTDANNCTATDCIAVVVGPALNVNPGGTTVLCLGTCTQLGGFPVATGGTPPYNFTWSSSTVGEIVASIDHPVVCPEIPTTYTLTVTDSKGCSRSRTVFVDIHLPILTADAGDDAVICNGSTGGTYTLGGTPTAIGGTAPYDYMWSSDPVDATLVGQETTANPVVSPTITTTYFLNIIDAAPFNCPAWDTIVVGVLPPLSISAVVTDANICAGVNGGATTITTTPLGGSGTWTSFSWSPVNGLTTSTSQNPQANPDVTTTYTVTVTDNAGCTASTSAVVNVYPLLTADAGVDKSICTAGDAVTLGGTPTAIGGTLPIVSHIWSSSTLGEVVAAISNPIVNPLVNTTYTVTVTDSQGCTATSNIVISLNPAIIVDAGNNRNICPGSSDIVGGAPTASGGGAGFSYNWSVNPAGEVINTTDPNPPISPTVTTTYCVTVTDANGCTASDCVIITLNPALIANAGIDDSLCNIHGPVTLGGAGCTTATGGSPIYTYDWSASSGVVTDICNPIVNPLVSTTYTLLVTDAIGCTARDTVVISVMQPLVVDAGTFEICQWGDPVTLGAVPPATGACGQYSYMWITTPVGGFYTVPNPTIISHPDTTWTLVVTDACCPIPGTDVAIFNVNPGISVTMPADTVLCEGQNINICPVVVGATPTTTYTWSSHHHGAGSNTLCNLVTPTVTDTYTLTIGGGCAPVMDSIVVNYIPAPVKPFGADIVSCEGMNVVLDALNPGYNYDWAPTLPTPHSQTISVTTSNEYSVYIYKGTCSIRDTINVAFRPLLSNLVMNPDIVLCAGQDTAIGATVNGTSIETTYSWSSHNGYTSNLLNNPIVSPTVNDTYTLVVTGLCNTLTDSMSIDILYTPAKPFASDTIFSCVGLTVGLDANPLDSIGYTYVWNPVTDVTETITVSIADKYVVTVSNGICSTIDSVEVIFNPLPNVNLSIADTIYICMGADTLIDAGNPGANYIWAPYGETTQSINVSSSGNYIVTVTNNCGSAIDSVRVIVNPIPLAVVAASDTICFGDTLYNIGAAAVLGSTYSWSPATGLSDAAIANPNAFPTVTTTYTLTETGLGGCTASNSIVVLVNPQINVNFTVVHALDTCGATHGEICAVPTGGGLYPGGFTFLWAHNGDATSCTDSLAAGIYCVTVTNGPCSTVACYTLSDPGGAIISLTNNSGNDTICTGESIIFTTTILSGGRTSVDSVLWFVNGIAVLADGVNPDDTTLTIDTLTLSPSVIRVKVVDFQGCVTNAINTITVYHSPVIDAGRDSLICGSSCIVLGSDSIPGLSYHWTSVPVDASFTDTLWAKPRVCPNDTTQYILTVTSNICGTGLIDTVNVFVKPIPAACVAPSPICLVDSIQVGCDSVAGNTYLWSSNPVDANLINNIANPWVKPTVTTTYTLTETNPAGCFAVNSVVVNPPLNITVIPINPSTCLLKDGTACVIVTGGTGGPYEYLWSNGDTLNCADSLSGNPGLYTVTVTDGYCTEIRSIRIIDPNASSVVLNITAGNDTLCSGQCVTFTATVNNAAITDTLSFYVNGAIIQGPDTTHAFTSCNLADSSRVWVVVTNASGCSAPSFESYFMVIYPSPTADAGSDSAICANQPVRIGNNIDTVGFTYTWVSNPPSVFNSSEANPMVNPSITTTYSLTVSSGGGLCPATDQIVVRVDRTLTADIIGSRPLCSGDTVYLGFQTASAGGPFSYIWTSEPAGFFSGDQNPWATPVVTTTYYLTQIDTDPTTCDRMGSAVITVNPILNVDAGVDTVICKGTNIQLGYPNVTGLVYSWSVVSGDTTMYNQYNVAQPIVNPTVSTVYQLQLNYELGACSFVPTDQILVNVSDIKVTQKNKPVCIGRLIPDTLWASPVGGFGDYTYLWSGPNAFTSTNAYADVLNFNDSINKIYMVTVTDEYGCKGYATDTIFMLKRPIVNLKSDKQNNVMYDASQVVTFVATPIGLPKYEFYLNGEVIQTGPSNTLKLDKVTDSTLIIVLVRNLDDCTAEDTVLMRVKRIPNAFTPNGDGVNDVFMPGVDLKVLNRWGQPIYQGTEGWDGTFKGNLVSAGTYFVIVIFKDLNNVETVYRGTVLFVGD